MYVKLHDLIYSEFTNKLKRQRKDKDNDLIPNPLYINDAMSQRNKNRPMNGKLPVASHSNTLVTSMTTANSYRPHKVTFTIPSETEMKQDIDIVDDRQQVEAWVLDIVGLPQYLNNFLDHGYDELRIIREIRNKEDLEDIGIIMNEHQVVLLHHIRQMQIGTNNGEINLNMRDDDDITPSEEIIDNNDDGSGLRMEQHGKTNLYLQESHDSDQDVDHVVTKGETEW